ncbi:MAG: hypothetical protein QGI68_20280 [Pseudomonadales bacterium]|nr:hypothetical protein [Pseudomonadales bacterium]MDP7597883.1 hypothetical protein [Pseudomonadales bacterium]HJN51119.1 hypothetical protein [Pseudomonadales bacterium]
MEKSSAVLGVSDHSGWAIFVCVAAKQSKPVVLDRRRVELLDAGLPKQPYHHDAADLDIAAAQKLIQSVKESAVTNAVRHVRQLQLDLGSECDLVAMTVRADPERKLPETVAEILRHHPSVHAADGILYREALRQAGSIQRMNVASFPRKKTMDHFADTLGTDVDRLNVLLKEIGKALGPPWQMDHKVAASAAMTVLYDYDRLDLLTS